MKTGFSGTCVIAWSQTEIDGVTAAPLDVLSVGASWRWTGAPLRVDGPQDMLRLDGAKGLAELRQCAARSARRRLGTVVAKPKAQLVELDDIADQSFVLTDGHQTYTITLLTVPDSGSLLLLVVGDMPPVDQDLWVVKVAINRSAVSMRTAGAVICFTPGTRIATPHGARLIEDLHPGDPVLTRDNGAQPVLWTGHRRISGARLHAMPHLRPIRFRSGAFGPDRPDPDLLVSPQHRMLLRGRAARALFNVDEVLVTAEDLVNDQTITIDRGSREVSYIHFLLDQHNIIWANGLLTESFHPVNAALDQIEPTQLEGLLAMFPALLANPHGYGDYARRNLSQPEAAILRHDMRM